MNRQNFEFYDYAAYTYEKISVKNESPAKVCGFYKLSIILSTTYASTLLVSCAYPCSQSMSLISLAGRDMSASYDETSVGRICHFPA